MKEYEITKLKSELYRIERKAIKMFSQIQSLKKENRKLKERLGIVEPKKEKNGNLIRGRA